MHPGLIPQALPAHKQALLTLTPVQAPKRLVLNRTSADFFKSATKLTDILEA
jgi:hypothetical protein